MIVSVIRYNNWTPAVIDNLYVDDRDHHGLEFWYNDAKEQDEKIKSLGEKKGE